jgi:hypothetical protein
VIGLHGNDRGAKPPRLAHEQIQGFINDQPSSALDPIRLGW